MKILLIMPPNENMIKYVQGWQLRSADYGVFPPLGLLYVATVLKNKMPDAEIKILDCPSEKLDYSHLERIVRDFCPQVIGISAFTVCLIDMLKVARLSKAIDKNIHVCVGGPHNFVFPRQTLEYPEIDSIVIGEGEYAFFELINQLKNGRLTGGIEGLYLKTDLDKENFNKTYIKDINSLPIFDINFIQPRLYYSTVGKYNNLVTFLSSRGCPYNCTFCDSPYKEFRTRDVENIIYEIKLRLRQGFKEIFFYDDTFNLFPQRVINLSRKIIDNGFKFCWSFRGRINTVTFEMLKIARKAGCARIHFGIETGTDEGLKEIKKGINIEQIKQTLAWCSKLKIKTIADFIIGFPFEKSKEDVKINIRRLIDFSPDYAQFNILQPLPGTEIYRLGVEGGIIDSSRWENFVKSPSADFEPPLWERYLSRKELVELFTFAYRGFYLRPKCIFRHLRSIKTFGEVKRMLKGGMKILFQN